MSQIVRIRVNKTQIREKEFLIEAIKNAGYELDDNPIFGGVNAEIKIKGRAIGFRKSGKFYDMVFRNDIGAASLLQTITQQYIYCLTRAKLEEQGFSLASEETTKDGRIHLVLRRMA